MTNNLWSCHVNADFTSLISLLFVFFMLLTHLRIWKRITKMSIHLGHKWFFLHWSGSMRLHTGTSDFRIIGCLGGKYLCSIMKNMWIACVVSTLIWKLNKQVSFVKDPVNLLRGERERERERDLAFSYPFFRFHLPKQHMFWAQHHASNNSTTFWCSVTQTQNGRDINIQTRRQANLLKPGKKSRAVNASYWNFFKPNHLMNAHWTKNEISREDIRKHTLRERQRRKNRNFCERVVVLLHFGPKDKLFQSLQKSDDILFEHHMLKTGHEMWLLTLRIERVLFWRRNACRSPFADNCGLCKWQAGFECVQKKISKS